MMKIVEEIVENLKEVLQRAERRGVWGEEVDITIYEEVGLEEKWDWDEWRKITHEEVPSLLRRAFRRLGLSCELFYRKDDIPGFEYVANCVSRKGVPYALGIDVLYDDVTDQLLINYIEARKNAEWSPDMLVYYTRV